MEVTYILVSAFTLLVCFITGFVTGYKADLECKLFKKKKAKTISNTRNKRGH